MSRVLAFVYLLSFLITAAFAQGPSPAAGQTSRTVLKAADLRADVAVLRHAYEDLHPGLYRYNTKSQMDSAFNALESQLSHDQSLEEAYRAFSTYAAKVRCGHTYANFYNQPKSVVQELFQGQNRVPFYFEWIGHQMVVTEDFTPNHQFHRGTQVLEIGGTPVETILVRLMSIARADGSNDAKRIASLGVRGDGLYETFDIYFPMFFPQNSTRMKLKIEEPGAAKPTEVEVESLTLEQRVAPIKTREESRKGGSDAQFDWSYLPDGSAYLRMPTWALYDSKWDWKGWLNAHLDELAEKKPPVLIVDLRGNEGGLDVGNVLLSRLIVKELKLSALKRLVRYRKVPDDLAPYLDTWDPSFKDWGLAAVELKDRWPTTPAVSYYRLSKFDDDADGDVIKAEGKHFAGKVFVLVDSNNSSATFQFAQVVQQNKLGTLVGQPTGGNQRGINGGAFFFLRLPKSKIEMDLPLIGTFPATEKPDSGLIPDIVVAPTVHDIAMGLDPAMTAVAKELSKPH